MTITGQDLASCGESSELVTCVLAGLDLATAETWAVLGPLRQLRDWQTGTMSWWNLSGAAVIWALLPLSQTGGCFPDSSCRIKLQPKAAAKDLGTPTIAAIRWA